MVARLVCVSLHLDWIRRLTLLSQSGYGNIRNRKLQIQTLFTKSDNNWQHMKCFQFHIIKQILYSFNALHAIFRNRAEQFLILNKKLQAIFIILSERSRKCENSLIVANFNFWNILTSSLGNISDKLVIISNKLDFKLIKKIIEYSCCNLCCNWFVFT